MNEKEFTKDLRNDILAREQFALDQHGAIKEDEYARHPDAADHGRMDAAMRYAKLCVEDYRQGLPHVTMSVCPFCAAAFVHTFDPYDMDGQFWRAAVPKSYEPTPCDHLCFFRGAVHLGEHRAPRGPRMGYVYPGPEVPYVIPKQLDLPGVIAVIGELAMEPGWQAYTIAYFANPKPAAELLTHNWCETMYSYLSSRTGDPENDYPNDPWDFELAPWIARGKLLWCVPGSGNATLADPKTACPYLNLPGRREALQVAKDYVVTVGVPDGTLIEPFE
jgi:hypothetical protein